MKLNKIPGILNKRSRGKACIFAPHLSAFAAGIGTLPLF